MKPPQKMVLFICGGTYVYRPHMISVMSIICGSWCELFLQALCLVTWIAVSLNMGNASLDGGFATLCKILLSSMTD